MVGGLIVARFVPAVVWVWEGGNIEHLSPASPPSPASLASPPSRNSDPLSTRLVPPSLHLARHKRRVEGSAEGRGGSKAGRDGGRSRRYGGLTGGAYGVSGVSFLFVLRDLNCCTLIRPPPAPPTPFKVPPARVSSPKQSRVASTPSSQRRQLFLPDNSVPITSPAGGKSCVK
ncbi:hypothetical protein E2C01_052925 [Portunus trituberculatus]|uniref:Uncharacterized protein n=1 Tax=Portunus trituberculatus TaxID=210409 RepID=A0A5B7GN61_PORTR|nr:hypothetical protein [Portunus trituberculatus]